MFFFVARRLLYLVPVLIAVSLLTFSIASLLPGDLAYVILGDQATPENVAALRRDMGLDQPIWWRYLSWLGNVRTGGPFDRFMTGTAFGMLSVPTFLSAILLIYFFAVELRWLPATGYVPFVEDQLAK